MFSSVLCHYLLKFTGAPRRGPVSPLRTSLSAVGGSARTNAGGLILRSSPKRLQHLLKRLLHHCEGQSIGSPRTNGFASRNSFQQASFQFSFQRLRQSEAYGRVTHLFPFPHIVSRSVYSSFKFIGTPHRGPVSPLRTSLSVVAQSVRTTRIG